VQQQQQQQQQVKKKRRRCSRRCLTPPPPPPRPADATTSPLSLSLPRNDTTTTSSSGRRTVFNFIIVVAVIGPTQLKLLPDDSRTNARTSWSSASARLSFLSFLRRPLFRFRRPRGRPPRRRRPARGEGCSCTFSHRVLLSKEEQRGLFVEKVFDDDEIERRLTEL
jgi:hypothetical protein